MNAKTPSPASTSHAHIQNLRAALSAAFVERGDVVDALLVAVLAGEHAFILGPPGTAKSALVRAVSQSLGLRYWEYLMTRFSTPEDVCGPVKLSALQADRYERATEHYLPNAEVAFLDEVWKANAAILNSLLSMLNERVYHNGGVAGAIPLVSAIGASNELPEGPELEALYDRFLVRLQVGYISDRGNFLSMLAAPAPSIPSLPIDLRAEQAAAAAVVVGSDVLEALADVRDAAAKAGIQVSDRRWRKALGLVRAAAHLDGRTVATTDDLAILEHSLWRDPSERSTVSRLVQGVVNPNAARAVECLDAARAARAKLPADTSNRAAFLGAAAEVNQDLIEIQKRVRALGPGRRVEAVLREVGDLHREVSGIVSKALGMA